MEFLAQVSGEGMVQTMVYVIIIGVIFGLFWWLLGYLALPQPFDKVVRVILILCAVLFLSNVLLGLIGHPIFRF